MSVKYLFTRAEAIAFAKKVDRTNSGTFYVYIRLNATLAHDTNKAVHNGLSSHLKVSRSEAVRMFGDMLSPVLEERGARIPVEELEHTDGKKIYWIG